MPDQVSPQKQELRSDRLIELAAQMQQDFLEKCRSCSEEVLAEETALIGGKSYMTGYSKNYIRCAFPQGDTKPGQIVRVSLQDKIEEGIMLCGLQPL